jgi:hypothetical protein
VRKEIFLNYRVCDYLKCDGMLNVKKQHELKLNTNLNIYTIKKIINPFELINDDVKLYLFIFLDYQFILRTCF